MRQTFYLLTDSSVRIEFHISDDTGLQLISLCNPPRDPDIAEFETVEEMADAMEDRVIAHMEEHHARLRMIRLRHDPAPIGYEHLGRYGVPLVEDDTGKPR